MSRCPLRWTNKNKRNIPQWFFSKPTKTGPTQKKTVVFCWEASPLQPLLIPFEKRCNPGPCGSSIPFSACAACACLANLANFGNAGISCWDSSWDSNNGYPFPGEKRTYQARKNATENPNIWFQDEFEIIFGAISAYVSGANSLFGFREG